MLKSLFSRLTKSCENCMVAVAFAQANDTVSARAFLVR